MIERLAAIAHKELRRAGVETGPACLHHDFSTKLHGGGQVLNDHAVFRFKTPLSPAEAQKAADAVRLALSSHEHHAVFHRELAIHPKEAPPGFRESGIEVFAPVEEGDVRPPFVRELHVIHWRGKTEE